MGDNDTPSVAKEKVSEVQQILLSDEYRSLSDFDNHRTLLRAAARSTNGHAGSIIQLSETVGLFAATYVEDRTREHNRIKVVVGAMVTEGLSEHERICAGKMQHTVTTTTTDKTVSDAGIGAVVASAVAKYPLVVFFGLLGSLTAIVTIVLLAIIYHGDIKPTLEATPGLDSPYSSAIAPCSASEG